CRRKPGSESKPVRAQTARRLRPLARRALMTARPPRVFMRTRKPWVRARRVLEGWYVRFMGIPRGFSKEAHLSKKARQRQITLNTFRETRNCRRVARPKQCHPSEEY